MINLSIFTIVQFQRATQSVLLPNADIQFNAVEGEAKYDCREDEAAMQFMQLIVTESIVKPVTLFAAALVGWAKKIVLKKKDWNPVFLEAEEIVWMLYYALAINLSVIFFPYNVMVQPLLISVVLNSYYYYLVYVAKKPVPSSNKDNTGTIVTFLSTLSFLIWLTIMILLMMIKVRHEMWESDSKILCGPIENLTTFQHVLERYLRNGGIVIEYGRAVVFSWPFTICALLLLLVYFQF